MPYLDDLNRFYGLLDKLKGICRNKLGFENWNYIKLAQCNGRLPYWKICKRGIYFFFDEKEERENSNALRVVRVGTHAIKKDIGKSTLWERLKKHKGNIGNMGGDHRNSKFRELVGQAMIKRDDLNYPTWAIRNHANRETRNDEIELEGDVSRYIRNLPFLILRVDPERDNKKYKSNRNDRKYLESKIIGLLSDGENPDEPSEIWLGRTSPKCQVRESGLWQIQGVEGPYDDDFFDVFEHYIDLM